MRKIHDIISHLVPVEISINQLLEISINFWNSFWKYQFIFVTAFGNINQVEISSNFCKSFWKYQSIFVTAFGNINQVEISINFCFSAFGNKRRGLRIWCTTLHWNVERRLKKFFLKKKKKNCIGWEKVKNVFKKKKKFFLSVGRRLKIFLKEKEKKCIGWEKVKKVF